MNSTSASEPHRRLARRASAAASLLIVLTGAACKPAAAPRTPAAAVPTSPRNLLWVVFDTTRADHLSAYGYAQDTTPTVRALASRGARFERAFAQASITPVSAASYLTGSYPFRHGVRSLFSIGRERMREDVPSLMQRLSDSWHLTAAFVSAGPMSSRYGLDRGFGVYDEDFGEGEAEPGRGRHVQQLKAQRRADFTTDRALEWLHQNGDAPFALFVHFFDVHDASVVPPEEFLAEHVSFPVDLKPDGSLRVPDEDGKIELYDAELLFMDQQLARLLDHLQRVRLLDDTLVVVMADHGEGLGDHGEWGHGLLYEEQLRVPLVLAGPGIPAGVVVEDPVRLVDVPPTVAELFRLPPLLAPEDGLSFLDLLRQEDEDPRDVYAEVHFAANNPQNLDPEMYMLRTGRWKYIHRPASGKHELYNLEEDPAELHNLYGSHPDVVKLLEQRLHQMEAIDGQVYDTEGMDEADIQMLQATGYMDADH